MNSFWGGVAASLGLLLLYALTMTALAGWSAAVAQFRTLWYLMIPLALGFGIQVGLFIKLKQAMKQKQQATLAASGTAAGAGMLACCAHHAADLLPILGVSAAATLVARYQVPLLVLSLLINLAGIALMKKHLTQIV
jgi:Cu+-exporting ATPase